METTLLAAGALSRFIIIQSNYYTDQGYIYRTEDGSVRLGEESVFSTVVKIEAERATSNDRYVNLRFCHNNRYWAKQEKLIVAESTKPEEDTTKSTCTLFEAVNVAGGNGLFYLNHVQSGGRLLFDTSMRFYVQQNPNPVAGYLVFVNWESIVKLPKHVAFKGWNGNYLGAVRIDGYNYLQFSGTDPNAEASGQEIQLLPDGHVRIKSHYWGLSWRRSPNWIWADSGSATAANKDTVFWPVKLDDTTIALRNEGNGQFCKGLTTEGKTGCLNAASSTITTEARLLVQELVLGRKIYNVRYWMENARIYNEKPFVAGSTTAFNYGDTQAGIGVEVSYEDSKSQSFSRSLSLTAGVKTTFEAGVPLITKGTIEVSFEINTTLEWNDTNTTTIAVKATGTVPVPPRSLATVSYVGTVATCDIPFSYTQQDISSTDGRISETEQIDGVFRGVNAFNFSFVVAKTQPL